MNVNFFYDYDVEVNQAIAKPNKRIRSIDGVYFYHNGLKTYHIAKLGSEWVYMPIDASESTRYCKRLSDAVVHIEWLSING